MVAPTRTPQARGVKCDLCKKILATATWLDQTKLAKEVEEAQLVLDLIKQHNDNDCPCIPKNIENLLVGSTHFEIHRLVAKRVDAQVFKRQYEHFVELNQKTLNETAKNPTQNINDCQDTRKTSRFKVYFGYNDQKQCERSNQQLRHLCHAIDYWRVAMEDQTNPFNSKLALRLGLTHHVIYSCYLFKYYKILDYQLISANLLLNLFKSIEGVTANAMLHANYLIIKTSIDCDQLQLARHFLKQATKAPNYKEKSHYESILLTCVACEMSLLDGNDTYNSLDELASIAVIKTDDKLQHYYARTLALSIIIKYIHCYPSRSDQCFEFFHTFRYVCAMIRRCYEDSFELVLASKELSKQSLKGLDMKQNQILDHSWIRFAVCDFAYSTFNLLSEFYTRSGMPETLELLYNGLNLIAFRNGSHYWQTKMAAIGIDLDLVCDKYDHAKNKLDTMSRIVGYTSDLYLMNLMRLESEVSLLSLLNRQESVINDDVVLDLLPRIKDCKTSLLQKLGHLELYDCKSSSSSRTTNVEPNESVVVLSNVLGYLSLKTLKISISNMLRKDDVMKAKDLITKFGSQMGAQKHKVLEYYENQILLEILVYFSDIYRSKQLLLETLGSSNLFITKINDGVTTLESHLSTLTLNSEPDSTANTLPRTRSHKSNNQSKTNRMARISLGRCSRRKGIYDVATRSQENLSSNGHTVRLLNTLETLEHFSSLTNEELVISYLRNSEPNPDYLLYRHAHELMFCFQISNANTDHDQLLYHFSESNTSNTMRYRWMMFEEQQVSPYDPPMDNRAPHNIKHLGFCNSLVYTDKLVRSFFKAIPEDTRIMQFKYILDKKAKLEHLLAVSFECDNDPFYIHVTKAVVSDNFFEDAKTFDTDFESLTVPSILTSKIEESKKALLNNNQRSRTETRQRIETDIGILLHDIENDWLGPFRFLICGNICDKNYSSFISRVVKELLSIMSDRHCNSESVLRLFLENAPLLNREEFCQMISILFNCASTAIEARECFTKWLKLIEGFVKEQDANLNKTSYIQSLPRGQVGIILEDTLEHIPFESLPIVRITKHGIFRVPSLRIFSILVGRNPHRADPDEAVYMLDPANNLSKTRERFDNKLKSLNTWSGTIGQPPKTDQLEQWLATKQIYIFIGHGAGTAYYNKLCKGRGLSAMAHVETIPIVMGCSSGRVLAEGPRLETMGIGWVFILRGAPCYVGLLWDVTDNDIDKFLDSFLAKWMPCKWPKVDSTTNDGDKKYKMISITEATAQARHVCQYKFLVGSTPIVYGLPAWCGL